MDRVGVVASAACAVHCLLVPVLLSFSSVFAHFIPGEESTHRTLAVLVAAVGALALGSGYRKHQQRAPFVLMACGLSLIVFTAVWGDDLPNHAAEVAITVMGSCCMIAAHRLNHTFCRRCVTCCEGDK